MTTLAAGFSRVTLSEVDVVLNPQNKIVGLTNRDGSVTDVGVGATIDPVTGGISIISKLSQAQYDALATKDDSTLYVIVG